MRGSGSSLRYSLSTLAYAYTPSQVRMDMSRGSPGQGGGGVWTSMKVGVRMESGVQVEVGIESGVEVKMGIELRVKLMLGMESGVKVGLG